jgi:hypothetical protein
MSEDMNIRKTISENRKRLTGEDDRPYLSPAKLGRLNLDASSGLIEISNCGITGLSNGEPVVTEFLRQPRNILADIFAKPNSAVLPARFEEADDRLKNNGQVCNYKMRCSCLLLGLHFQICFR